MEGTGIVGGIKLLALGPKEELVSAFYLFTCAHLATNPQGFASGKSAHPIWTQVASKTRRMAASPSSSQTIHPSSCLHFRGEPALS